LRCQGPPVDIDGLTHHSEPHPEIRESWVVVFDGDGEANYKTALLAGERAPNQFDGFWSDDPEIVDSIETHLERTYLTVAP
jgi:hypothetical protein